jgi:hypothetical protein
MRDTRRIVSLAQLRAENQRSLIPAKFSFLETRLHVADNIADLEPWQHSAMVAADLAETRRIYATRQAAYIIAKQIYARAESAASRGHKQMCLDVMDEATNRELLRGRVIAEQVSEEYQNECIAAVQELLGITQA